MVITNLYLKLLANINTLFIFKRFFLEKIDSKIKKDIIFLHLLIRGITSIEEINATNYDNHKFFIYPLVVNSRPDLFFKIIRAKIILLLNIILTILLKVVIVVI